MEPPATSRRSFTVRLPVDRYLEIMAIAQKEGCDVNRVVARLIDAGLGHHVKFEEALRSLLIQHLEVK